MSILMNHSRGTITASSGTGSATILAGNDLLTKIFIKAASNSTTFDIKLTDIYDNIVLVRENETGEISENDVNEPAIGNYTLTIENASKDEAFTYLLILRAD